jgi:meso-butanediol dehydrogenase/(S,S)-butanediol dehydrogenase/diacetyl reductase
MSRSLEGKAALVTGAARGIGRAIALELARAGANVAALDLGGGGDGWRYALAGKGELESAAEELRGAGVRALALACDVADAAQVARAVETSERELGRLDVVVNNAGIVIAGGVAQFDEKDWDRVMAVNLRGPFLVSRAAIPALARTQGAIVNIASVAGKRGYAGMAAYCASKFGVVGLTQSLAAELGPLGIRANAVCPGFLATAMWDYLGEQSGRQGWETLVHQRTPLRREQTPEDIAGAVLYLATAPNVSGVALNVAGGYEVW